ncbi:MAG: hypothetical protein LBT84_08055 [Spirochaetia bacterium]|nr:hypothetical protein [Spirochaetia bacterium]
MEKAIKETITIIKNKEKDSPEQPYFIDKNDMTIGDDVSIFLGNHSRIELYTGENCDIEISDCKDVTIYCNSKCNILIRNQCDIEIFSDNYCKIVFCGNRAKGGRIVCGNNCHIICWPNVEIEAGDYCIIDCDYDCNIDCRNNCSIKGNKPRDSFSVHCLDNCAITCNKHTKIETHYDCDITWVDDAGAQY